MDEEQLKDYHNGNLVFFDSTVTIEGPRGEEIGHDSLGESCYYADKIQDFYTAHRHPDPFQRNSSIMREARGKNVVICHYFPSMVREACARAREYMNKQISNYQDVLALERRV
jgi:hypothetical protein